MQSWLQTANNLGVWDLIQTVLQLGAVGLGIRLVSCIHIVSATKCAGPDAGEMTWATLGFSSPPRERTP